MPSLMVIIPDRLSEIVAKGEIAARYYNPGNLFDEVHILMTNDDRVDPGAVRKTVGDARLHFHNLPAGREVFFRSLGWRPWLLKGWAEPAVTLAREIRPSLIRCHGNDLNTYVASRIKKVLGIPYVVSLHINPDEDMKRRSIGWRQRILTISRETIEKIGLRQADIVLPVYEPILPYIKRLGARNYEVVYNVLNQIFLKKKDDYRLHEPVRLLSVGRQFKEKNPENLIRAMKALPGTHLTLVGDGPYHDYLRGVVRECGVEDRVTFHRSLPNDELCAQLPDYDIFAVHTEYWEISKAILEALLTGLPVIINRRVGQPVPELQGNFVMMVDNTVGGYHGALKKLIEDNRYREELGRLAYAHAQAHWAPDKMEARVVEIYRKYMRPG